MTLTINNAIRDAIGDIVDSAVTSLATGFMVLKLDNAFYSPDQLSIGERRMVAVMPAIIEHSDVVSPSVRECTAHVQVDMRVMGERYDDGAHLLMQLSDKIGDLLFSMPIDWATDDMLDNKVFVMERPTADITAEPSTQDINGNFSDTTEASITITAKIFKIR